jgi:hypothetical protein
MKRRKQVYRIDRGNLQGARRESYIFLAIMAPMVAWCAYQLFLDIKRMICG